jgi:hypothetical protein
MGLKIHANYLKPKLVFDNSTTQTDVLNDLRQRLMVEQKKLSFLPDDKLISAKIEAYKLEIDRLSNSLKNKPLNLPTMKIVFGGQQ